MFNPINPQGFSSMMGGINPQMGMLNAGGLDPNMLAQLGQAGVKKRKPLNQNLAYGAAGAGLIGAGAMGVNAAKKGGFKIEDGLQLAGSIGSAFGPVGSIVGGLVSGVGKLIGANRERKEQEKQENEARAVAARETSHAVMSESENAMRMMRETQQRDSRNVNSPYNLTTKYTSGIAKYGGKLPKYNVGGAVGGGLSPIAGGDSIQLSEDDQMLMGNTHEQGGIPMADEMGNPVLEAEGGETIRNEGDGEFIFSDSIINPATGNTFAKDSARIMAKKGKAEELLEKKKEKLKITTDKLIENEISVYNSHLDELQLLQEAIKEAEEAKMQEQIMAQQGGGMQQEMPPEMMQQEMSPDMMEEEMPMDMGMPAELDMQQGMEEQMMGGQMMMKYGGMYKKGLKKMKYGGNVGKSGLPKYETGGDISENVTINIGGDPITFPNQQAANQYIAEKQTEGYTITSHSGNSFVMEREGKSSWQIPRYSGPLADDNTIRKEILRNKDNPKELERLYKAGYGDKKTWRQLVPEFVQSLAEKDRIEGTWNDDIPPLPNPRKNPPETTINTPDPQKQPTPNDIPGLKMRKADRFGMLPYTVGALGTLALSRGIKEPPLRQQQAIRATGVNYDASRDNVNRSLIGAQAGLAQGTSNSAIANANRAALMATAIQGQNQINESEANQNAQIFNQALSQNAQIDGNNTDRWNNWANSVTQIQNDKNFVIPTTVLNKYLENMQANRRDNFASKMYNNQMNMTALSMYNNADDDGKRLIADSWNPYASNNDKTGSGLGKRALEYGKNALQSDSAKAAEIQYNYMNDPAVKQTHKDIIGNANNMALGANTSQRLSDSIYNLSADDFQKEKKKKRTQSMFSGDLTSNPLKDKNYGQNPYSRSPFTPQGSMLNRGLYGLTSNRF